MEADAYHPDSICWALGVGRLDPGPVDAGWALRVVLIPSFHPEICVTLTATGPAGCSGEVVVPIERVWNSGLTPRFVSRATVALAEDVTSNLPGAAAPDEGRAVQIDGMSFAAILRSPAGAREIDSRACAGDEADHWLRDLLTALHARTDEPGCRRALARAGTYVGLALACPEPPAPPAPVRVAIFGAGDEREAVIRALDAAQALRNKPKPP